MTLCIAGTMPHASGNIGLTESAAKRARLTFNPSGNERVLRLKTLAAAFYTECEAVIAEAKAKSEDGGSVGSDAVAAREASTAMTNMQTAAMFAVSAATA
jgi:hypothetical protein